MTSARRSRSSSAVVRTIGASPSSRSRSRTTSSRPPSGSAPTAPTVPTSGTTEGCTASSPAARCGSWRRPAASRSSRPTTTSFARRAGSSARRSSSSGSGPGRRPSRRWPPWQNRCALPAAARPRSVGDARRPDHLAAGVAPLRVRRAVAADRALRHPARRGVGVPDPRANRRRRRERDPRGRLLDPEGRVRDRHRARRPRRRRSRRSARRGGDRADHRAARARPLDGRLVPRPASGGPTAGRQATSACARRCRSSTVRAEISTRRRYATWENDSGSGVTSPATCCSPGRGCTDDRAQRDRRRPARAGGALARIHRRGAASAHELVDDATELAEIRGIVEAGLGWVAEKDGAAVGMLLAQRRGPRVGRITDLYVRPSERRAASPRRWRARSSRGSPPTASTPSTSR